VDGDTQGSTARGEFDVRFEPSRFNSCPIPFDETLRRELVSMRTRRESGVKNGEIPGRPPVRPRRRWRRSGSRTRDMVPEWVTAWRDKQFESEAGSSRTSMLCCRTANNR
jgi:hypothetical protein